MISCLCMHLLFYDLLGCHCCSSFTAPANPAPTTMPCWQGSLTASQPPQPHFAMQVVGSYVRLTRVPQPGLRHGRQWRWGAATSGLTLEEELNMPAEPQTAAWATLCLLRAMLPRETPGVQARPHMPTAVDVSGILAGLLLVYGVSWSQRRLVAWRTQRERVRGHVPALVRGVRPLYGRPGLLGAEDLLAHAIVGAGTLLTLWIAARPHA